MGESEAEWCHGVPGCRSRVLPVPWGPRDSCTPTSGTCGTEFIPGLSLVLIVSPSSALAVCPGSDPSPGAGDVLVTRSCRHYLLLYSSQNKHYSHLFINHFSNSKETSVQIRNYWGLWLERDFPVTPINRSGVYCSLSQ